MRAYHFPVRRLLVLGLILGSCARFSARLGPDAEPAIEGVAVDWRTGAPVGGASIRTIGIVPELATVAAADGTFRLEPLPINGYVILEVVAEDHEPTLSAPILVEESDLSVVAPVLRSADADAILVGFAVTTTAGRGFLAGRALRTDLTGMPNVAAIGLAESAPFGGPHFLDESLGAGPISYAATTSSGGFVLDNVIPGSVTVVASAPGLSFPQVATVAAAGAWSIVELRDTSGLPNPNGTPGPAPTPIPTAGPQSFEQDIEPIFSSRGCNANSACHRGGAPAGNMRLEGTTNTVYNNALPRCNLTDPASSLLLVKPLFEATPNHGGGNIFLSTADPDYQKILRWITDGALDN